MDFDIDKIAAAVDEGWRTNIQTIEADGVKALVADIRKDDHREIVDLKNIIDHCSATWRATQA